MAPLPRKGATSDDEPMIRSFRDHDCAFDYKIIPHFRRERI
jgi:hypothetical protein